MRWSVAFYAFLATFFFELAAFLTTFLVAAAFFLLAAGDLAAAGDALIHAFVFDLVEVFFLADAGEALALVDVVFFLVLRRDNRWTKQYDKCKQCDEKTRLNTYRSVRGAGDEDSQNSLISHSPGLLDGRSLLLGRCGRGLGLLGRLLHRRSGRRLTKGDREGGGEATPSNARVAQSTVRHANSTSNSSKNNESE